ncbi:MAG: carboxylesterase family protein [Rhizobiales bacterium]|nr:carboxylesterase family protein [Hyphomicrobiales bacterium]
MQQVTSAPSIVRTKGPLVWLDMDQKELDDAYDQSKYAFNQEQLGRRRALLSELARQRLGRPQRFAYGAAPIEGLDLYPARQPNAPVVVFTHGGAWRHGVARDNAYAAEMFVNAGAHYIALDFSSVVEVGGDLMVLADQVCRAMAWVYDNAASFGGDRERIYAVGHSSGAHLNGVLLTTDWSRYGLPANIIKAGLCCSGMYDLKPVRLSARSTYVAFTDEIEEELSAQRHIDRLDCPIIVAHGTLETPEFQRQARDFAAAVKAAGKPVRFIVAEAYNHFEMSEMLGSPYSLLGHELLRLTGLSPPAS